VPDTRRCPSSTRHRHLWLHWIMSLFQIIIDVDVSVSVLCLVSVFVSMLHKWSKFY
jgi:hypothetical protein